MVRASQPGRWRRSFGVAAAALVATLAVLLPAAPAAAHAQLVGTDPAAGAVLPQPPERVTLTFNEPVRLTAQEITVYDDQGREVAAEAVASGPEVVVALADPDAMVEGSYVVGWYVVSADGHPISGSLTFSVGVRTADALDPPPPPESSRVVEGVQGVLQGLAYLGLLVAAGLAAFVVVVLPQRYAGERLRLRLRTLVRAASVLAAAAAVLLVPVASVYAQGAELPDLFAAFDLLLVRNDVVFAAAVAVGLGGVVALLPVAPPTTETRTGVLALAALAVVAPAVVGHTRAYQPAALLLAADAVHLLAGAVWLGGLVGLTVSLAALARRETLAADTLARFSLLAGGLLLTVAGTGAVLAWRILGSWSALVDTAYGRLLLVKIGIALVVAAVAGLNRWRLLPRVRAAAGHADRGVAARTVTRAVAAEALLLVGLLGVTGFLVNSSPRAAPVEVPAGRTGVEDGTAGEVQVLAALSPRRAGPNVLLVQLQDAEGEPVETTRPPQVQLRSGDLDLGSVPLTSVDAGTWRASVLLPRAGTWEVQVAVRESRFSTPVTTLRFEVAEP